MNVRAISGWVLSGLLVALYLMSAGMKLGHPMAAEGFAKMGLSDWLVIIAIGEIVSAVLFIIPRTAILGLLLLSSYMGGAIITHMMHPADGPWYGAAVILVLVWVAGFLRMPFLLQDLLGGSEVPAEVSGEKPSP